MPPVTLAYRRDGRWYVGWLVEVHGVFSQGTSLRALRANVADAYREMHAAYGHALPRRRRRWAAESGARRTRLTIQRAASAL